MLRGEAQLLALFLDLLEEARVVDGDRRLRSEGFQQAHGLRAEGAGIGPADGERADHLALVQQRYGEYGAHAGTEQDVQQRGFRILDLAPSTTASRSLGAGMTPTEVAG